MTGGEHVSIWSVPERPGRGPRPAYSRVQITEAAIRIADADGLEAASMRRIAADLGTAAMSLYRYVSSRDDLVELMADHVLAEMDVPPRPSGDWRADLTLIAESTRAIWLRHPWLAGLDGTRAMLGPNRLRLMEFAIGALDVGPPLDDVITLIDMLNGYVQHVVRGEIAAAARGGGQGRTPPGPWRTHDDPHLDPHLRDLLATGDFPRFERVVREARLPRMSGDEQFRHGLERVLDCIARALP
ncbi:TetR/AcrR family transcriptional regulator [Actinomadura sp. 7K534]|uniref:TetR/AcrR family transcriptional regulator n=1 Tax=Actinomadura sp. 7K534 TaxID=2530366 RepID=UPI0010482C91|nr:TetR/AcrR family transcriptional regulator [Actinomadura sp. 7K534]TDB85394.1 TetR/AcrR family transcriptional regulator [Actinomadura sp. 7K534]